MKRTGMTMIEKGVRSYELRTWGLSHEGNRHMGIAAD